jgi:hypothetical protein
LPWWFPRDFGGREITRANGVFDRFHSFGFDRIYPNYDALAVATEKHEYLALKYEIEQMRQQQSIQGYVITELTDANWESNGLMSMWRQPKVFAGDLGRLQQDDLVMANFPTYNFTAGSAVELPLMVSHYSTTVFEGARILWQTSDGQSGDVSLSQTPDPGAVAPEGVVHFQAGVAEAATPAFLRLQLVDAGGKTLAQNRYRYSVYPQATPVPTVTVTLHDPLNELQSLRAALTANGVHVVDETASAANGVWLSSTLDSAASDRLRQGQTVLLLAGSPAAIPAMPNSKSLRILPRAGSDLNGDWVSNFNWAFTSSPFWKPLAPVIDSGILGWEAASVTPDFVIEGVSDSSNVLAGVFYGWLNDNHAYLADVPQDSGHLLVTTFRFQNYGKDPFATLLLNQLLSKAGATPGKA